MELKKSPKADRKNKRRLLIQIGVVLALALVIAAFAYTPKEHRIEKVDMNYGPIETEITEVTRQDQKPPEPPKKIEVKVIADLLQIVDNNTKVTNEVSFVDFDDDTDIIQTVDIKEEVIEDDQPFLSAEEMPTFQGGSLNDFRNWVQKRLNYPQIASENGIQGKVIMTFVVERDGRLTNIQILQTPDRSLSEEAIRVLNQPHVFHLLAFNSPLCKWIILYLDTHKNDI